MTHLHLHTNYSLLDGLIKIKDLMTHCKSEGMTAVACTDHGTLGGIINFHREAISAGIKPILGCEFYHDKGDGRNNHLVLLAKNREGYDNLVKLNNIAQNNFYKKPRIRDEHIREHGRGLIALTACIGGYFNQSILNGRPDIQWIESMKLWVDHVFVEVQNHGIKEERVISDWILNNRDKLPPIVATADCHYLLEGHSYAHRIALATSYNKKVEEVGFDGYGYHVHTPDLPQFTIDNTQVVADLIEEYDLGHSTWQLPTEDIDYDLELKSLELNLETHLLGEGLNSKEYVDRLHSEWAVLRDNGFVPYLRTVAKICNYADTLSDVRGYARGSAGGSLVVMLYGITKIDPVKWGLYFERFLNAERVSPPDIDLDFTPEVRVKVIEWLKAKYNVYQIGTYSTLSLREAINSTERATGIKTGLVEYVPMDGILPTAKYLMSVKEGFYNYVVKNNLEEFISWVEVIEDSPRNSSAHASGIVIDLHDELPIQIKQSGVNAGLPVTMYDMYTLEELKLTKFDILGINTLAIVDDTIKHILATTGDIVKLSDIPLDDEETFKLFNSGHTQGVFQFETHTYKETVFELHPDNFDELIDLNALGRPACLDSGMTKEYISRKFGKSKASNVIGDFKLGHQNLPLFQEDMMLISREVAGFSMSEADTLRKAISKKQKDLMDSLKDRFVSGSVARGYNGDEVLSLWETIEASARYSWNLSHAVAYTMLSYWTMWFSTHYPLQFFTASLSRASNTSDSIMRRRLLLSECRRRGIEVKHPDVNKSTLDYSTDGKSILLGLGGIKYVGDKAIAEIIAQRPYEDYVDFESKVAKKLVNSKAKDYLIKAGCFGRTTYDDELDAVGCSIGGRKIDQPPYHHMDCAELLRLAPITTKKGEPMAFTEWEYRDEIKSIVIFPRVYEKIKSSLRIGMISHPFIGDKGELIRLGDCLDMSRYIVNISSVKMGEFLSCYPSFSGQYNIVCDGVPVGSVPLTDDMLSFIDESFTITKIKLR